MNDLLISILVTNFNKAPYLRECLDSVLAQTYSNWECVIVDDHSTDESWYILEGYAAEDSRFQIFKRPDYLRKGGNSCRNYAFELSQGEFIQWFDSDDLMGPSLIEGRINALLTNNELDFIFVPIVKSKLPHSDIEIHVPESFDRNSLINSFIKIDPAWVTPCCFIKKEYLIEKSIKWDESLSILQDVLYDFDLIFNSNNYSYHQIFDWKWIVHTDGNNVGSGRARRSNLFSLYRFIYLSKSRFGKERIDYDFLLSLKLGYIEIVRSSFELFGLSWWYYLILKIHYGSIRSLFFSFKIFTLVILSKFGKYFSFEFTNKVKEYSFYKIKKEIYDYY